jgi:hypothetical protein
MAMALLDGKTPTPTRKQELDVQAAILAAMRNHDGKGVRQVNESRPTRWAITEM